MAATFEAIVENGIIRLPEGVTLPERTTVYVVVPQTGATKQVFEVSLTAKARMVSPRLKNPADRARFEMEVQENAPDAAV